MTLSGQISAENRYRLALQAGFSPQDATTATAISYAECANCDLAGVNPTGDLGLMQINKIHWPQFGGQAALVDPMQSMRAAFGIFKSSGWTAWCTYPGGCGNPNNPGTITPDIWAKAQAAAKNVSGSDAPGVYVPPGNAIVTGPTTIPGQPTTTTAPAVTVGLGSTLQTLLAGTIGPNLAKFGIKPDFSGLILLLASIFAIIIGAMIWRGDDVKNGVSSVGKGAAFGVGFRTVA